MASLASLLALTPSAQQTSLCPFVCHLAPTEHWEWHFHTGPRHLGHNGLFLPLLTPEPCIPVAPSVALATADDLWTPCAPSGPKHIPSSSMDRTS